MFITTSPDKKSFNRTYNTLAWIAHRYVRKDSVTYIELYVLACAQNHKSFSDSSSLLSLSIMYSGSTIIITVQHKNYKQTTPRSPPSGHASHFQGQHCKTHLKSCLWQRPGFCHCLTMITDSLVITGHADIHSTTLSLVFPPENSQKYRPDTLTPSKRRERVKTEF